MNWDAALEITRFVLGALLVLANVAVWYGVWLERESAPPEVQQRGWRILVRGLAAETTIGFLLFAADTSLGLRQAAKLNDAQTVAAKALDTGLTLKRLNSGLEATVTRQTAAITGAQDQLGDLTNKERDLANKEGKLRAALNTDETHVREIDAWRGVVIDALKPRDLSNENANKIISELKGHHFSKPVPIYFLQDLDESFLYPMALALALTKGGVDANPAGFDRTPPGMPSFPQPISPVGITVYEYPDSGKEGDGWALIKALGAGGIRVLPVLRNKPEDAIRGAQPMLAIFIGRKPNPFWQLPAFFPLDPKFKAMIGTPSWEPSAANNKKPPKAGPKAAK